MSENIKEEIEDKIIDLIALGAKDRLVVFKPENSDKDLVVEKRGDYKKKVISLNIYSKESSNEQDFAKELQQLFDKKDLKPSENFYLVFVYFDIVKQNIDNSFLVVPSLDLEKILKQGSFSNLVVNKNDFSGFLIKEIEIKKK